MVCAHRVACGYVFRCVLVRRILCVCALMCGGVSVSMSLSARVWV